MTRMRARGGVVLVLTGIVVVAAVLTAYRGRYRMNFDGVSYLDLSDAVTTGHWKRLVNNHWSPLYPALIGLARLTARPSRLHEYPLVHAVNAVIFVFAWFCFLRMFFAGWRAARLGGEEPVEDLDGPLRDLVLAFLTFCFLWYVVTFVGMELVTPDLLASSLAMLAMAEGIEGVASGSKGSFPKVAAILMVGYFAKSTMFPIFLLVTAIATLGTVRGTLSRRSMLLGVLLFLIPAVIWMTALRAKYHHVTFSDDSAEGFAQYLGGAPLYSGRKLVAFGNSAAGSESALHLLDLTGPEEGTLYGWLEPWSTAEAYVHRIRWREWPYLAVRATNEMIRIASTGPASVIALGFFILVFLSAMRPTMVRERIGTFLALTLPCVAGVVMLCLIVVEGRLVAPFVLPLAGILVMFGTGPKSGVDRVAVRVFSLAGLALGLLTLPTGLYHWARVEKTDKSNLWNAQAMISTGLRAGDRIVVVGDALTASLWARAAGLTIAGEMRSSGGAARFDAAQLDRMIHGAAYRSLRAEAVVSPMHVLSGDTKLSAATIFPRLDLFVLRTE